MGLVNRSKSVRHVLTPVLTAFLAVALAANPSLAARSVAGPSDETYLSAEAADGVIADLAASLDYDVEQLFRFVADEIRYEPYPGILRGAGGVLDARAGNSKDQAALLAALLDASLVTYRFAQGSLSVDAVQRLADSARLDDEAFATHAASTLLGDLEQLSPGGSAQAPDDGTDFSDALEAGGAAIELSETRARETVDTIVSALEGEQITLPALAVTLPDDEVETHTWVQFASGPDWVDLDPSLSGSSMGEALGPTSTTLELLPDTLRHRVKFTLVVERVDGDALAEEATVLLDGYADDLDGLPIRLVHAAPDAFEGLGLAIASFAGESELEYSPYLLVGDTVQVVDTPVTFGITPGADGGLLSESGLLDTQDAGGSEDAQWATGEAVSERLEVEVSEPFRDSTTATRVIFDRIPADVRSAREPEVSDVQPIDLVVSQGSALPDYAPMLGVMSFAVTTTPTSVADVVAATADERAYAVDVLALAYHALRDALGASIGSRWSTRPYADGPNIVSASLSLSPEAQEVGLRFGLDIWHQAVGMLPVGSEGTIETARVLAGALSQLAERTLVEAAVSADGSPGGGTVGVSRLFEEAHRSGVPIVVLDAGSEVSLPAGVNAPPELLRLLGAGHLAIAPATPILIGGQDRQGWWIVDPATGRTVDMMDDGSGTEVGYIGNVKRALDSGVCFGWNWGPTIIGAVSIVMQQLGLELERDGEKFSNFLSGASFLSGLAIQLANKFIGAKALACG